MIEILRRQGIDDMTVVARWDEESGWLDGGDDFGFPNDEHYDEDMMVERFDGPTYFARPADAEKAYDSLSPPDFDVVNDVDNDSDHPERDAPENERERERQQEKDQVGPPQATLLGVGDELHDEDDPPDDDEDPLDEEITRSEGSGGRTSVDRVDEAPDDKVVQADVDDEGDVEGLYYE